MHSKNLKFTGGACPQTPLVYMCIDAREGKMSIYEKGGGEALGTCALSTFLNEGVIYVGSGQRTKFILSHSRSWL